MVVTRQRNGYKEQTAGGARQLSKHDDDDGDGDGEDEDEDGDGDGDDDDSPVEVEDESTAILSNSQQNPLHENY